MGLDSGSNLLPWRIGCCSNQLSYLGQGLCSFIVVLEVENLPIFFTHHHWNTIIFHLIFSSVNVLIFMEFVLSSQCYHTTSHPKLGDLKQQKCLFSLIEARRLKLRFQQCHAPSEGSFCAFLLASGVVGNHWHSLSL